MFQELLPGGLSDTARNLEVPPMEVVRLMVATDSVTPGFSTTADHVAKLREFGGIESGWWDDAELPEDDNPQRQRVRGALGLILGRCREGAVIRMDNLWRGLPEAEEHLVDEAVNLLADEELLLISNTVRGVVVSVPAESVDALTELANGIADLDSLTELYQG